MDFDTFIETGWKDHGERPQEVADRLAVWRHRIGTAAQIAPFARLLTHVYGEHLGQWQRGIELLDSLKTLRAYDGSEAATAPLVRSTAVLRYAGGDRSVLASLDPEDRVQVLSVAASALAGRLDYHAAIDAYRQAVAQADTLPPDSFAFRALASGGNNLAATLEEKPDRDALETEGMVAAAQSALTYWKIAGTWLEEERAEYRLARSLLRAGRTDAALAAAVRCEKVCRTNDSPALELFFAHAVQALAHHARGDQAAFEGQRRLALDEYARVPADERVWCDGDRKELDAAHEDRRG